VKKNELISQLITQLLEKTSERKSIARRSSLFVGITPPIFDVREKTPHTPRNNSDLSAKETDDKSILHKLLTEIKERWEKHSSGLKKDDDAYQGQEDIIEKLLPFIEQALDPNNNIKVRAFELLNEWDNKHSNWVDLKLEKHFLKNLSWILWWQKRKENRR